MGLRPGFSSHNAANPVLLFIILTLAGCAGDPKPPAAALSPTDFVAKRPADAAPSTSVPTKTMTVDQAREGVQAISTTIGAPAATPATTPGPTAKAANPADKPVQMWSAGSADVPPAKQPLLVDAKVGDINNRAVYASAFLRDLEAELTNKARDFKAANPSGYRQQWASEAERVIRQKLESTVIEEILRANAYSSLSAEQQAGFRNFIEKLQGDYIRQNYGSRTLTEQAMQENSGMSLDQVIKKREQRELVMYEISREVDRKIQVPYRDVEMYYERQYKRYNPPPKAVFRMIRVPEKNDANIQAVRDALDGGQAFEVVAALPANTFKAKDGGLLDPRQYEGDFTKAEFFSDLNLNAAAHVLTPGTWTGPVLYSHDQTWLYLQEIQSYGQTLYDAQIDIEDTLKSDRKSDEIARYVAQLRERAAGKQGAQASIDDMVVRLVDIARERCLEPVAREGANKR